MEVTFANCHPGKYWHLLTPKFEFGCKVRIFTYTQINQFNTGQRRVFDHGYLESLNKDKVRLTDDRIDRVTENSVVTKSGDELFADAIVSHCFSRTV